MPLTSFSRPIDRHVTRHVGNASHHHCYDEPLIDDQHVILDFEGAKADRRGIDT